MCKLGVSVRDWPLFLCPLRTPPGIAHLYKPHQFILPIENNTAPQTFFCINFNMCFTCLLTGIYEIYVQTRFSASGYVP